jgi:hypothetical protein
MKGSRLATENFKTSLYQAITAFSTGQSSVFFVENPM